MTLKKTEDIWKNVFTQNMQKLVVKTIGPKFQSFDKSRSSVFHACKVSEAARKVF